MRSHDRRNSYSAFLWSDRFICVVLPMTEFDITKMVPRDNQKPKPKARIDPIFADFSLWSKNAIHKHYPELVHKLIPDE